MEHTLFTCAHWEPMRISMAELIGHPDRPEDIEPVLGGSVRQQDPATPEAAFLATRRAFMYAVEDIMGSKQAAERARQLLTRNIEDAARGKTARKRRATLCGVHCSDTILVIYFIIMVYVLCK